MKTLRKFFSYYKPYKKLFIVDFSCSTLASLLELAFPLAISYVLDDLLPKGNWKSILYGCMVLLGIYFISAFLHFIVTYWGHKLGISIEADMRKELFEHVQRLSFSFFDNNKTGHLVSRMTNDLMDMGELAHHGPEDMFIAAMTLIGALAIMLSINLKLAIITFITVPFMIYLSLYFSKKMSNAFDLMYQDIADYNARVENNISGIRVVQAFTNESYEINRFHKNNHKFFLTKCITYRIMAWNSSISYILMKLVSIFVLLCGTWFVIKGEMSNGEFISFVMLSNVFLGPIEKIAGIIETYPKGAAGFKRYLQFLETKSDVKNTPNAKPVKKVKGHISYNNVTFGYENKDSKVLANINLTIDAGETVALVGPSGSGKTTLCSLLPRFYDLEKGSIKIDGIDIKDITLSSLRGHIGIVQQDVFLFDGTIRENIAYGKFNASEDEIWEAIRQAQLEEVILSQPEGLNTFIGERGIKLSGGQKQRLSIARMFLKNPSILILDEATSALDSETEAAIQKALEVLSKGRTTLIIAHRLSTIKNADKIVVLNGSGIAEAGTHHQLINNKGIYSRLYTKQNLVV
ncbi:TPA: ABC transporter ATP-binding protein [Clostridium botulinum]|uniref:ABC transporter ATP-binding protein n=1 Tax=Clostridium botulinum TaxID=1491 RepID=UPI00035BAA9B|nr:ABC transporter ATP-binding protein [Clostridium botulinum]APH23101.1 ABC transporter family protein [Clostridium botulinum]APQ68384.1 ABC transporter family protein [Clostridium botulinum]EPS56940.1 lipid A export ATP-binding/permease MsbA [Clostridium botulinum Af84]MBN3352451.1 ABC transporter ATP-binding protein [Clostridium botulinum]MBN3359987.1 ABC transporter ATP-binding protein [Clostridium botulinum]